MSLVYLGAIILFTFCIGLLDWRYKLALFYHTKQAIITLAVGFVVFLVWDILGIGLGIFINGNSPLTTGIMIAPELPLEELFFLFFLCYFTLIVFRGLQELSRKRSKNA